MASEETTHSKPDDPYTVKSRWDDEGFHILVEANVLYDALPPDEVRRECQRIAQELTEGIFKDGTFKRHVDKKG